LTSVESPTGEVLTGKPHKSPLEDSEAQPAVRWHRALLVLAAVAAPATAFEVGSALPYSAVVAALLPTAFGVGLLLAIAVLVAHSERQLLRLNWALLGVGILSMGVLLAGTLFTHPGYMSDEAAFQQAAATLLLHGHDPYGANLASSLTQFRVTPQFQTYTLGGGVATTLGYPALPTLIAVIGNLLVGGSETQPIINVVVLAATMVLMFKLLEPRLRPLAVIAIVPMPMLFGMATAAMTEVILAPLLMFVAYRWSSVGRTGRLSHLQTWQAVALGLALATQQEAWFAVPFVIVGIFLARNADIGRAGAAKVAGRYLACAAAAFLVINLAFIVWGPKAWLLGVTTPLRQNALPLGQGLVDWTVYLGHGGGMLSAYTYAGAALLAGLVVLYILEFRVLARAMFALPVLPLFICGRSLAPYFIPMVCAMVVSVATLRHDHLDEAEPLWRPARGWLRPTVNVVCVLPTLLLLGLALTVPAPLTIQLLSSRTLGGQVPGVFWLQISVHNRSSHVLTPRFITNSNGTSSAFWHQTLGPGSLAAGATATYRLEAPDATATFGANNDIMLGAVTSSPATYSSAGRIASHPDKADLEPAQIDNTLRAGQSLTFTVQLRAVQGAVLHYAGVQTVLTQKAYSSSHKAVKALADVNGKGAVSSVEETTNSAGQAIFHVTDDQGAGQPVVFQVHLLWHSTRYGYSNAVPVTWARK
jgi:uncharacterized membrane protein